MLHDFAIGSLLRALGAGGVAVVGRLAFSQAGIFKVDYFVYPVPISTCDDHDRNSKGSE